jgi:hypothetical protein
VTNPTPPELLDPAEFLGESGRLFIDTNMFMDTDDRRTGAMKRLFERCASTARENNNPLVVPSKVVGELTRHSRSDLSLLSGDRAQAVLKAKNALVFIDSAEASGLIRKDLGDATNPYADDLFVRLFATFGGQYKMCLLTNDITLRIRIRLLAAESGKPVVAGGLTRDGLVEVDSDQGLFEKGQRKLMRRLADNDQRAVNELQPLLAQFRAVTDIEPSIAPGRQRPAKPFTASAGMQPADTWLAVGELPGEGDKVRFESASGNGVLGLERRLAKGGEGVVYSVDSNWVVKIFDRDHITAHRKEKIRLLVAGNIGQPGICCPEAVVTNMSGQFVGYRMPRAKGEVLSRTIFRPRRFLETYPNWTKADLVDVCISFLEKLAYLHSLNIIVGDINPKNLMVDASKEVSMIDADSWQLDGYPCPVGTPMFTAPSAIGKTYSDSLRTMEEELFAVATMLFMILITGQFPYARKGSEGDIVQLIRGGNFAFQYKGNSNQDQPEGNWKFMWSHIRPDLKGMFWNTFHRDGSRYNNRPTAEEWLLAFREYRRYLTSDRNFDPMSNDVYPTRFRARSSDTPIYECAECGASMAGIWREDTASYFTPRACHDCRQNRPKCLDCHKPKPPETLNDGRCSACLSPEPPLIFVSVADLG